MEKLSEKLSSRKFWVLIIGIFLQVVNTQLDQPLTDNQMLSLSGVIVGYFLAQGWVDGKTK
jgi:hypothetical protein